MNVTLSVLLFLGSALAMAQNNPTGAVGACIQCGTAPMLKETVVNGRKVLQLTEGYEQHAKEAGDNARLGTLPEVELQEQTVEIYDCNKYYSLEDAKREIADMQDLKLRYEGTGEQFYLDKLVREKERRDTNRLKKCYRRHFKIALHNFGSEIKYYLESLNEDDEFDEIEEIANRANGVEKKDKKKVSSIDELLNFDLNYNLSLTRRGPKVSVSTKPLNDRNGRVRAELDRKKFEVGYHENWGPKTSAYVKAYIEEDERRNKQHPTPPGAPKYDTGVRFKINHNTNIDELFGK